jgi:hypothetical protein
MTFISRVYFLDPGTGREVELPPGFGEAIAAGDSERPQPMGCAEGLNWWILDGRIYSTSERLTRAAVLRLVEQQEEPRIHRAPPRSLSDSGRGLLA